MCCSVLQCVAVCCSVLQCVAVCCTCFNAIIAARVRARVRAKVDQFGLLCVVLTNINKVLHFHLQCVALALMC